MIRFPPSLQEKTILYIISFLISKNKVYSQRKTSDTPNIALKNLFFNLISF